MKVEIPKNVAEKLQKRVDSTDEFDSVQAYVEYILKQVVERLEEENSDDEQPAFSEEDEEKVKERLRSLGYLD
ncbi:CopG family transcriptional regulator [Candidatus Woesearchaeota archaeon]|nr:CopG family transcriptional regulator [Candidatus Woesearchaeota archaeon]MBW3005641.1 CopG family transcriptional regulator [Candidatus Woesearchaeota archaeon]